MIALGAASFFGTGAFVAVLAAGIAIILPEAMHAALMSRMLCSDVAGSDKVAQAFRARLLKIAATTVFMIVSLKVVGVEATDVFFWALTVLMLALLPGFAQMAGALFASKTGS